VSGAAGFAGVFGLDARVNIQAAEAINVLAVPLQSGSDLVEASGRAAGTLSYTRCDF
jgi:hypothetical protein